MASLRMLGHWLGVQCVVTTGVASSDTRVILHCLHAARNGSRTRLEVTISAFC